MSFEEGASPPEPASALCDYLDELVEGMRKLVPAALKEFDETSIHHARVATRRLKAAIDLLEPVLSEEHRKPFTKAGRQLRRRLGPLRDLDVMIDHLKRIQRRATHRQAAAWLEQRLFEARDSAREDSTGAESPGHVLAKLATWWGLREEILGAADEARSLLANALHLQLDAFAEQADQLAKKDPAVRQDPHQVRIAGKALRYTLEMAKCEGHPLPGGVAKAFKQMQDALGGWHDFVVLTERAMCESLESLLAHHDMQLQRKVLDLSRWTLGGAQKELDRFSALWAQKGPELLNTIRHAVPLAQPALAKTAAAVEKIGHAERVDEAEVTAESEKVSQAEIVAAGERANESKMDHDLTGLEQSEILVASPVTDPEAA